MQWLLQTRWFLASTVLVLPSFFVGCDGPSSPPRSDTDSSGGRAVVNSLGMKFVRIPAGTFQMGSTAGQTDERPVHEVTISESFYLSEFEVTQAWWTAVMGHNPSRFRDPWRPVEQVSWTDVQRFIQKLNEREGVNLYRLPSEAEWEYATRAHTRTTYYFGNDRQPLPEHAWYYFNAEGRTLPVGRKRPNPYGLHEVYGNVWEWVLDAYDADYYAQSPEVDPRASNPLAAARVIRGGGWQSIASDMRSANRGWARTNARRDNIGFRLVREIPDE